MHPLIEALHAWGCDAGCVQSRFMGDEEFYLSMLGLVKEDPSFSALEQAIDAGSVKTVFDAAHTLKGMLSNMGLTPLLTPTCAIVEKLRGGVAQDIRAEHSAFRKAYAEFMTLLGKYPIG